MGHQRNVVGLLGGLGNQLFQYAFAQWLESQTTLPSQFDDSAFRRRRGYLGLHELGLAVPIAPETRALPYPYGRAGRLGRAARRMLGPSAVLRERAGEDLDLPTRGGWYYGYWQRPRYYDAALQRIRESLAHRLRPEGAIGVHVRRGDMLGKQPATSPSYYRDGVALLRSDAPGALVHVFTDDEQWCREHLEIPDMRIMSSPSAAADLLAAASSDRLVLSSSTFSWWAAALRPRPEGSVVAPQSFLTGTPYRDLADPSWRRLPANAA